MSANKEPLLLAEQLSSAGGSRVSQSRHQQLRDALPLVFVALKLAMLLWASVNSCILCHILFTQPFVNMFATFADSPSADSEPVWVRRNALTEEQLQALRPHAAFGPADEYQRSTCRSGRQLATLEFDSLQDSWFGLATPFPFNLCPDDVKHVVGKVTTVLALTMQIAFGLGVWAWDARQNWREYQRKKAQREREGAASDLEEGDQQAAEADTRHNAASNSKPELKDRLKTTALSTLLPLIGAGIVVLITGVNIEQSPFCLESLSPLFSTLSLRILSLATCTFLLVLLCALLYRACSSSAGQVVQCGSTCTCIVSNTDIAIWICMIAAAAIGLVLKFNQPVQHILSAVSNAAVWITHFMHNYCACK